jgi:hypothetical protein
VRLFQVVLFAASGKGIEGEILRLLEPAAGLAKLNEGGHLPERVAPDRLGGVPPGDQGLDRGRQFLAYCTAAPLLPWWFAACPLL